MSHARLDLGNHASRPEFVQVTGGDDLEAAALVVLEVALLAHQRGADAGVDRRVENEALLVSEMQERAVIDSSIVRDAAAEHVGVPGVDVAVEVDYRDWAPALVGRPEGGEGGGVVTTESEDAGSLGDC